MILFGLGVIDYDEDREWSRYYLSLIGKPPGPLSAREARELVLATNPRLLDKPGVEEGSPVAPVKLFAPRRSAEEVEAEMRRVELEKVYERKRRYQAAHPERVKESNRRYREENAERVKETRRRSKEKNLEAVREQQRSWAQKAWADPEKRAHIQRVQREYRARMQALKKKTPPQS